MTDRRMQPLTSGESLALLASTPVGRVVFTERALPAVLPVTFVVDGDTIVVRTARGSRLARAAVGGVLAFEADELHPASRTGWSVVVTGQAYIEDDAAETERLSALLEAWVPGIKDVFIRIPLTLVSGRRIEILPVQPHAGGSAGLLASAT